MEKELISVIVPIYKGEQWLDRCIHSILTQDYENTQVILVDDGSPDRSGEISEEWAKKDARVKVVHKENGGLSDARNAGLDVAEGAFIMFLDEDDYMHPSTITIMHNTIVDQDADMVACNFEEIPDIMVDSFPDLPLHPKAECFSGNAVMDQLWDRNIHTVVAWNKIYKREIFDKARYIKGRVHDDESAIHYVLHQCKKTAYIEEKLYYYVQREGSITAARSYNYYADGFRAYKERLAFLTENGYDRMAKYTKRQMIYYVPNNYPHMVSDPKAKEAIEDMQATFHNLLFDEELKTVVSPTMMEHFAVFDKSPQKYYALLKKEERNKKVKEKLRALFHK